MEEGINWEQKIKIIFATFTILLTFLLSWIEISDAFNTTCNKRVALSLTIRYITYIFSKFYILSLWNLDIIGRMSYKGNKNLRFLP